MAYSEALARRARPFLQDVPGFSEKKMFGGVGFLINGNMACGVNGPDLIVRLDPGRYAAALGQPHVRVFDMTGRPMKGWVVVAPEGVASDEALGAWVREGVQFAQGLPPK
jgi:hypothetical protein